MTHVKMSDDLSRIFLYGRNRDLEKYLEIKVIYHNSVLLAAVQMYNQKIAAILKIN